MADDLPTIKLVPAPGEAPLSTGARLLLVEDDPSIRATLAEMLSDEGYTVTTAMHGREALKMLRLTAVPDAILLDLMMPVMDGWEFRVEQRADPLLAGIPLLAMSADLSAKARAIAADAYVRKPIDFPELLRLLQDVVGRAIRHRQATADRMAALGTLASGIAHEINNPLTYVIANLQRWPTGCPPRATTTIRDLSEVVADALEGAERIRRLVKEVQRVSPGQHDERLANVALRDPLRTALALTENQIKHRARLVCALEPDVYVRGDHERIEQLFVNLLLNAAQAIPEGQAHENEIRVDVRALPGQGTAIVRIEDTGTGIPLEVSGKDLPALLHDQAHRAGDRAGPLDLPRHRHGPGRARSRFRASRPAEPPSAFVLPMTDGPA